MESANREQYGAYLFCYFTGGTTEKEKLYYGVSKDGYHFKALNDGYPIFTSFLGTGHLRDPFIFLGEDGSYYIAATDMCSKEGWASQSTIVIYKTEDLIHIEEGILIDYKDFCGFEDCDRAWAPHVLWSREKNAYMVYLTLQKKSTEDQVGSIMYRHYAGDLMDVSTYTVPVPMMEGPGERIDGDIIYDPINGRHIMYYNGKYVAEADALEGVFQRTKEYVPFKTKTGEDMMVEGSNVYQLIQEDKWIVAADGMPFNAKQYGVAETTDFKQYRQLKEGEYSFDFVPRHGFVIPITVKRLELLMEQFGKVEL